MKFLLHVDRAIASAETALLVCILGVMVLLGFAQVLLRNFFSFGFPWVDSFLRHMVLWIAFLGASLAVQERKHLNIDVLTRLLPETWKRFSWLLTDLFAAVVCFAFLKASLTFLSNEIYHGMILFLGIPTWYFQIIIPIGYGMLCFRFLIKVIEDIRRINRGDSIREKGRES